MLSSRPVSVRLDSDAYSMARTPAKALLKSRGALQENAVHHASATVNGKGKKALQQTPHHPNTIQPERLFKDPGHKQPGLSKLAIAATQAPSRPLGDKTPFPNRIANHATPLPATAKIAKPLLDVAPSLTPTLRPSSTRKHIRAPRSAVKNFETPVTGGQHWDVSDISIANPDVASNANQSVDEEDYDEIEYMPPTAVELPYEPPFELPDYKEVGRTILTLSQSYIIEDLPEFDNEFELGPSDMANFFAQEDLLLPDLKDDSPFQQNASKKTKPSDQRVVGQREITKAKVDPRPISRPAKPITSQTSSTVTKRPPIVSSRAASTTVKTASSQRTVPSSLSRPGTVASVSRVTRPATSVGVIRPVRERADTVSRLGTARPRDGPTAIPRPASTGMNYRTTATRTTSLATARPGPTNNKPVPTAGRLGGIATKASLKTPALVPATHRKAKTESSLLETNMFTVVEDDWMAEDDFKFAI